MQHAIDVEATVQNNFIDVGIFAPVEMLHLEDGKKLIEGVKLELEGACE
jgi:hypothetical protein